MSQREIGMNKYLYIPQDIALYFSISDFTLSDEKKIRDDLWERRDRVLAPKYRKDKYYFIKQIAELRIQYEDNDLHNEVQVINKVLKEIGSSYELGEKAFDENRIEAFFRFVKLRLTYTANCSYVRLKLRTLLREFGYKRRTAGLVCDTNRSMKALKLESYLRNYERCDIGDIKLDDMIMVRLK